MAIMTTASISIVEVNTSNTGRAKKSVDINPLIARGAFGHVDIALLVQWASDRPSSDAISKVQSVSLAAIKTIPNATIQSSSSTTQESSASLTRDAFAELNSLRVLNGHENVTPLLSFYGANDTLAGGSGGGGGFGGWDWADNSFEGKKSSSPTSLCLVFPYHPVDLADALSYRRLKSFANGPPHHSFYLPHAVIQSIMYDIMSALQHLHQHQILHRDIKPGNLYITNDGRVQLGDFGLAKAVPVSFPHETTKLGQSNEDELTDSATHESNPSVTQGLCTLQYRPPELLLGGTGIINEWDNRSDGVNGSLDIWSAGCIFAELLTLSGPLFPGQSVLDQLGRIFRILGTPTEESWPGVSLLPDWDKISFELMPGTGLNKKIVEDEMWDNVRGLIDSMLSMNPHGRPSAKECIRHSCFSSFGEGCGSEESWRSQVHQSVVDELIPSFLKIENAIYFSPPTEATTCKSDDQTQHKDPFGFAKQYASELASYRRTFPQSSPGSTPDNSGSGVGSSGKRWKFRSCQIAY